MIKENASGSQALPNKQQQFELIMHFERFGFNVLSVFGFMAVAMVSVYCCYLCSHWDAFVESLRLRRRRRIRERLMSFEMEESIVPQRPPPPEETPPPPYHHVSRVSETL